MLAAISTALPFEADGAGVPYYQPFNPVTRPVTDWTYFSNGNGRVAVFPDEGAETERDFNVSNSIISAANRTRGNVFRATTNHFLTTHAIYLGRTNTSTVTLFVLEGTATNGVFTNIYQSTVTTNAGTGYVQRTGLSIPLYSGRYYAVAASWTNSMSYQYGTVVSTSYNHGVWLSGYSLNTGTPPSTTTVSTTGSTLYRQRIETSAEGVLRFEDLFGLAGSFSTNRATLVVDYGGYQSAKLSYRHRSRGDEAHAEDGVFLSTNNSTYVKIHDPGISSAWRSYTLDIAAAAASNAMTLSSTTYIRFQQMDDLTISSIPGDGREFDDVRVYADADFKYQVLYIAPTQTFRGVSIDKSIVSSSLFYEVGDDRTLSSVSNVFRYKIWDGFRPIHTTEIARVSSFAPYQNMLRIEAADPVIPAATRLTNTIYYITGFLDANEQFTEGSENNNVAADTFRVNHYSGTLFFNNVQTEITLSSWADQTGFPTSATHHVISGTGTVAGYPFAYTNLKVRKDLNTLHYVVDPFETQNIYVDAVDLQTRQNVDFYRPGGVWLNRFGGTAKFFVYLPAGAGMTSNTTANVMQGHAIFNNIALDSQLLPLSPPALSGAADVAEESKPLRIQIDELKWYPNEGRFQLNATNIVYVRDNELTDLEAVNLASGLKRERLSNEQYYRRAKLIGGPNLINIRAGSRGEALLDMDAELNAHSYPSHFPYGTRIDWTGTGYVAITGDLIRASASYLQTVATLNVAYLPGCNDGCPGGGTLSNLYLAPDFSELTITPDGGLHAQGVLTQTHNLAWGLRPDGLFAQEVGGWTHGNFHAPGHFLRGDQLHATLILSQNLGPGVLLNSGVSTNGQTMTDRFGAAAYKAGLGDYAGINLRVGADAAKQAESTLGSSPSGAYDLKGISKYYARLSGVSGLHQSMPETFPDTLDIYGYPFEFTNYGLNYLSNSNRDSVTEGSVELVYPSDFIQDFENLTFTCPGDLDNADIPGSVNNTNMVYWNAPLAISSMAFERNSGCTNIGSGYLTLGVSTFARHITPPLTGKLGFFSSGNIIPASFGLTGVDSRLFLPASIDLDGPRDETYTFMPVTRAYFNHYALAGTGTNSAEGFVSFAGAMDVPFFQDLLVQFHVPAGTGTVGSIHMMGGWPDTGWTSGGNNFFNVPDFDDDNRAWPAAAGSIENYRSQTDEDYLVRAKQSWLGLVDLTYPLIWSDAAKSFVSSEQSKSPVFVLSIEHQVDYLSAERAELSFGLQYGELPSINLVNMVVNEINEATGTAQAFIEAAGDEIVGSLDNGLDQLDNLIDNQARALVDDLLDSMVDPIIDDLFSRLQAEYIPGIDYYTPAISNYVLRAAPGSLNHAIRHLADGVGYGTSIVAQVDSSLASVEQMLRAVSGQITIDPDTGLNLAPMPGLLATPEYPLVGDLANGLLQVMAQSVVDALAAELQPQLDAMLEEVKPSLEAIEETSDVLLENIDEIRNQLTAANAFISELEDAIDNAQVNDLTLAIALDLEEMFADFPSAHNPFDDYSAEEMKAMIRTRIEARLFGSPVMSGLTTVIRSWVYDINTRIRQAVDSMFQQVNTMMREVVSSQLAGLDNSINDMLGDVSDVIGTGQIDGYAHITGDTLSELRLDGKFQWEAPDAMEFSGYLLIKEIGSDGSSGCSFGSGGVANTVEIGANRVGANWLSSDVSIDVAVKFTIVDGLPAGLGGALELASGTIDFEAFEINDFGATVMFGLYENYLGGRMRASFSSGQVAGGAFFGRTCTLDPIVLVDPDVADVLGTPPFSGIYVYGEAWMPIIDYGCLFNISAGVGAGFFFFVEGPTIGAKMLLGVSGEALCVVGVSGEVKLVGVKSGNDLSAKGVGTIKGKVGACPFCVKFKESVEVLYKNGSWDVNY